MCEIILYSKFGKHICQPFEVNTVDMCKKSTSDLSDLGFVDHDLDHEKSVADLFGIEYEEKDDTNKID